MPDTPWQTVGQALTLVYGSMQTTRAEFARASGVDVKTLYNFEVKGTKPAAKTRSKIEEALGREPGTLIAAAELAAQGASSGEVAAVLTAAMFGQAAVEAVAGTERRDVAISVPADVLDDMPEQILRVARSAAEAAFIEKVLDLWRPPDYWFRRGEVQVEVDSPSFHGNEAPPTREDLDLIARRRPKSMPLEDDEGGA